MKVTQESIYSISRALKRPISLPLKLLVPKLFFLLFKDAILGTKNFNTHGIQYSYAAAGDLNLFTKGYNSNSYALGLTAYAGGSITTTRGLIHGFPGITQIVPRKFFAHPNQ